MLVFYGSVLEEVILSNVQSIQRAFDILEVLATERDGMGVTQLGERLDLHKSTVHRLLNTMMSLGYIDKKPITGVYCLGMKFVELASLYLGSVELKAEANYYMREYLDRVGLPLQMAILSDGEALFIEKVEQANSIRIYAQIGRRVPIYCSSLGKALVFDYSDDEIEELYKGKKLEKYTEKTITSVKDLIAEINTAREQGWSYNRGEFESDVHGVAAPIYDYRGVIIAAIGAPFREIQLGERKPADIAVYICELAKTVSMRMGYNYK